MAENKCEQTIEELREFEQWLIEKHSFYRKIKRQLQITDCIVIDRTPFGFEDLNLAIEKNKKALVLIKAWQERRIQARPARKLFIEELRKIVEEMNEVFGKEELEELLDLNRLEAYERKRGQALAQSAKKGLKESEAELKQLQELTSTYNKIIKKFEKK